MSPRAWRVSSDAWWVGTRRPRAGPAACRSSTPLQTLAVHAAASEILPIHPVIAGHQEHVQRRVVVEGMLGQDPYAPVAADGAPAAAHSARYSRSPVAGSYHTRIRLPVAGSVNTRSEEHTSE